MKLFLTYTKLLKVTSNCYQCAWINSVSSKILYQLIYYWYCFVIFGSTNIWVVTCFQFPLSKQINEFPFQSIVFNRIGLQMFKYNSGDIPNALKNLFKKNSSIHNYNTRSRDKLRPALSKHRFRDKDFSFISVHIWNYICENINISINFFSFKKKLKSFILSEKFSFNMKLNN